MNGFVTLTPLPGFSDGIGSASNYTGSSGRSSTALGGHIGTCTGCGKVWGQSYNSCRDRHCPECQAQARQRWLAAREAELLPAPYFHLVFTLPLKLNSLIRAKPAPLYNLLIRSVPDALIEVAVHPKRPGTQIGCFAILHTCRWASSGMTAVPPVSGSAHRLKEYRFSEDLRY